MLERAAEWIQAAMCAQSAQVVVQGTAASSGGPLERPVLTAPIPGADRPIGQVFLGPRATAYSLADSAQLVGYAKVVARVLTLAGQQRQWRNLAFTDQCSGLHNRRYFNDRLTEILGQAQAERASATVLLFDLDDFKGYNDQFGHGAGDEILRTTGALMRRVCREHDVVTRYGGDEFAVIFWDPEGPRTAGSKHPQCALSVLDRFQAALRTQEFPLLGPTAQGKLTISGGLATFPWDGSTAEQVIQRADEALLSAKRAGKNRIQLIGQGD
jgi:diguanylate cyclase (GGDEF)-like protein